MRPIKRPISASASRRNASAVFFQLLQFILIGEDSRRAQQTDLLVDHDQFLAQAVELTVALHLHLHFFQFRSQGEISRLGLTSNTGIPQVLRSVPGMILLRADAVALAALAKVHRDGAPAEIAEALQTPVQLLAAGFERFE